VSWRVAHTHTITGVRVARAEARAPRAGVVSSYNQPEPQPTHARKEAER
jgi:NADPH-dependent curcumin reductase CurA